MRTRKLEFPSFILILQIYGIVAVPEIYQNGTFKIKRDDKLNNRPRKTPGYATPNEVFSE